MLPDQLQFLEMMMRVTLQLFGPCAVEGFLQKQFKIFSISPRQNYYFCQVLHKNRAFYTIHVTDGSDRTSSVPRSVLRFQIGKGQGLRYGILVDTICVLPVQRKCRQELKLFIRYSVILNCLIKLMSLFINEFNSFIYILNKMNSGHMPIIPSMPILFYQTIPVDSSRS